MANWLMHRTDGASIPDFLLWLFRRDEWRKMEREDIANTIAYAKKHGVSDDTIQLALLANRSETTDFFLARKK